MTNGRHFYTPTQPPLKRMNKKWMKFPDLYETLRSSICENPKSWMMIVLHGKKSFRLVSGQNLLLTGFSQGFFLPNDPDGGREFSWLINSRLGEQAAGEIIGGIATSGWSFKHPVIAHEAEWILQLTRQDPDCEVYARYEGADVLRFSART